MATKSEKALKPEKNAHEGHRQRVRDMLETARLDELKPHLLIEYLLFHTLKQRDTNELAHQVVDAFPTLPDLFSASVSQIVEKAGIGESAAIFLKLCHDIYNKYGGYIVDGRLYFDNPLAAEMMFRPIFAKENAPKVWAVLTTRDNAVLRAIPAGNELGEKGTAMLKKITKIRDGYGSNTVVYLIVRCNKVSEDIRQRAENLMDLLNMDMKFPGNCFFITNMGVQHIRDGTGKMPF